MASTVPRWHAGTSYASPARWHRLPSVPALTSPRGVDYLLHRLRLVGTPRTDYAMPAWTPPCRHAVVDYASLARRHRLRLTRTDCVSPAHRHRRHLVKSSALTTPRWHINTDGASSPHRHRLSPAASLASTTPCQHADTRHRIRLTSTPELTAPCRLAASMTKSTPHPRHFDSAKVDPAALQPCAYFSRNAGVEPSMP